MLSHAYPQAQSIIVIVASGVAVIWSNARLEAARTDTT